MKFEKLMPIVFLLVPLFLSGACAMKKGRQGSDKRPFIPGTEPPLINCDIKDEQDNEEFAGYLEDILQEVEHSSDDGSTADTIGGSHVKEGVTAVNQSSGFVSHLPSELAANGKGRRSEPVEQDDKTDLQSQPVPFSQGQRVAPQGKVMHAAGGSSTVERFVPNTSNSGLGQKTHNHLKELDKFLQQDWQNIAGRSAVQPIQGSGEGERQTVDSQLGGFVSHQSSGSATGGKGQHHPMVSSALISAFAHLQKEQQQRAGVVFGEKRKAATVLEAAQLHKKPALGEGSQRMQAPHQHHFNQPVQKREKDPQMQATGSN